MAPKHGQVETLPGIEVPTPASELERPRSLVTVTRWQNWGIDPSDYGDITTEMRKKAEPGNFLADLTHPSRLEDTYGVSYETDEGLHAYVALNPHEYGIILRSSNPRFLGRTVTSSTRRGKYSGLPQDALTEVATSKEVAAFAVRYQRMGQYITKTLLPEAQLLGAIQEAADLSWRGRGKSSTLRMKLSAVLSQTMPNMLGVVGLQRGWNEEKADRAKRSLEARLFHTVPDRKRIHEWQSLLSVLSTYNEARETAFKERMGRIQNYLRQIAPEVELAAS